MARGKKLPVCKPCWELKYCPYGVLVETMPLPHARGDHGGIKETPDEMYARAKETLRAAMVRGIDPHNDDELWKLMFFVMDADPIKWEAIEGYRPDDISCRVWGHACPVFAFSYLNVTETRHFRRTGRRIPREIMLKVARRDNYQCQRCSKSLKDDELEFDHLIPHAKGGPTSVENVRLLCRDCNRAKSDSLSEVIDSDPGI